LDKWRLLIKFDLQFLFILCLSPLRYNAIDWRIPSAGLFMASLMRGKAKDGISFLANGDHVGEILNGSINET
jgi:hypothetical protein